MSSDKVPFIGQRRDSRTLLVENKLTFAGPETELSIYDTYRDAVGVGLDAEQLLYCGMVSGKKLMHDTYHREGEWFLPHESYVMPPGEYVEIDFPDASELMPTTCLTIEISRERIESIAEKMRTFGTLADPEHDWAYQPRIIHTHHTQATQHLLERLVALFVQGEPDKEIMVDLGISELVTRLLREQGREVLLSYCHKHPDASGITAVIGYLQQDLSQAMDIDELCRKACMSRSRLYVEFKKQLGCTPGEFQQQMRMKSAAAAISNGKSVTDACYSSGFNDLSHFSRRFSAFYGCSPTAYRKQKVITGQNS
ncbi:Transcriptional regulator, AraC family [Methylophaga frappieri]|uniref:Transcriptional regulator, AraC family n=1 Tax=Methylophaga frappieri (strain ATCC BAA-2434 / DSM 25690 / JAM7) TaxID=754477 RepID=I1YE95_METFJ|nr:helix-turn-helix domain-containing protein [Methylophaga frappieri]AFJ01238.1 Transcriptional regulator, AraC family [Methylophaga frappieri]